MKSSLSPLIGLVTVVLYLAGDPAAAAPPKPLPEEVRTAWEKAGAQSGWLGVTGFRRLIFRPGTEKAQEGDVPTFKFYKWHPGELAKLPPPEAAFGLDLSNTKVTDAGLKELADLKQLQVLFLGTNVTNAGKDTLRSALPDVRIR